MTKQLSKSNIISKLKAESKGCFRQRKTIIITIIIIIIIIIISTIISITTTIITGLKNILYCLVLLNYCTF